MDQLSIETVRGNQDGIRIIRLIGPFTLQGIFDFQSIYRSGNEPVTIIDLTEVPYMDSAALGAVVGVHTSSQRQKRHYAIVGASDRLRTLFHVGGVDGILITSPSLEEAQQRFASYATATGAAN
jgi:anti-anti-sigma regulatory factor